MLLAAAGDVPTQEIIAAAGMLRDSIPELKVRVVNVIDLATLQTPDQHPAGLEDAAFDALFTLPSRHGGEARTCRSSSVSIGPLWRLRQLMWNWVDELAHSTPKSRKIHGCEGTRE